MDMLTLALDTSSAISVAVLDGDEARARESVFAPRGHAELLAPMIREVLARAGSALRPDGAPAGIDGIVVGTGPAPFTGLRVGLVTARTLALAWGVPVWGVCSLDALGAAHGGAVTVVSDARRREVYWARYEAGERVEGPAVSPPAEVPGVLGAEARDGVVPELGMGPAVTVFVGRGAALYPEAFGEAPPESEWHPDPVWLARIAARRFADAKAGGEAADLSIEPLYLRRPDVHGTPHS
jgi:tRNA threonylcarbamoyladenosine biosynthesis protein TsaB